MTTVETVMALLPPERIAELRKLHEQTTPNWYTGDSHEASTLYLRKYYRASDGTQRTDYVYDLDFEREADAVFAAHAHAALPDALDAIERMREDLDGLRQNFAGVCQRVADLNDLLAAKDREIAALKTWERAFDESVESLFYNPSIDAASKRKVLEDLHARQAALAAQEETR